MATGIAARSIDVRACLSDPLLGVMNFLNEAVADYPSAISFAPGRPHESCVDVESHLDAIQTYVDTAPGGAAVNWRRLGQYSRTNGFIGDRIAAQLARDENIHVDPDAIIVTVGAQEAMAIVLGGLFEPARDVLLVSDPSYIGITGLAALLGIRVVPVPSDDEGVHPQRVERAIAEASRLGRVRALYDIPDFNNPLGTSLPLARRHELLALCHRHDVLVIEDNAYGMFAYDHERPPTLKSLDDAANVIYIGSFAKTLFPGLRLGYLVADQRETPGGAFVAQALSRVKSLLTVNTPPLLQALAAGMLHATGGSLEPIVAPKRARYRRQRDAMAAALQTAFADADLGVSWTVPGGGFFLPVTLPFAFGPVDLRRCAADHGVIVCPMQFFCLGEGRRHQVRLSFSYVEPEQIHIGIARFAEFVRLRWSEVQAAAVTP